MRYLDVAIKSVDEQLVLAVEIVARQKKVSLDWAKRLHASLLERKWLPGGPYYFLLATPERFYLWTPSSSVSSEVAPDYEFDPQPLLKPYLSNVETTLGELSESSLELLLSAWLSELAQGDVEAMSAVTGYDWLFDSGLCQAIRHGLVQVEASA